MQAVFYAQQRTIFAIYKTNEGRTFSEDLDLHFRYLLSSWEGAQNHCKLNFSKLSKLTGREETGHKRPLKQRNVVYL